MKPIAIVLIEKIPERAALITGALRVEGECEVTVIDTDEGLARRIAEIAPDLVLIDVANPSRDTLEELSLAASPMDRPVAMFVDQSDRDLTRAAISASLGSVSTTSPARAALPRSSRTTRPPLSRTSRRTRSSRAASTRRCGVSTTRSTAPRMRSGKPATGAGNEGRSCAPAGAAIIRANRGGNRIITDLLDMD